MKNLKYSILFKIGMIAAIIIILLIPAIMVKELINERERTEQGAIAEVSSKWGNGQIIKGPYISIPYDEFYVTPATKDTPEKISTFKKWLYILPNELIIDGNISPEKRYRGIYEVVVYDSKIKLSGSFDPLNFKDLDIEHKNVHFEKATLNIGIADLKGIEKQINLNWNGTKNLFDSGISTTDIVANGIHAPIAVDFDNTKGYDFNFELALKGSQNIYFTPVGKTTNVKMGSTWQTPSFTGNYIPDSRSVTETGFTANWNILHLNRNYPQQWKGKAYQIHNSIFGIDLLLPVDKYKKSYRVARYAILFLVLTFMVFFFVEVMNKIFIHPIQYLLVGIAIIIFYALLLSFSEHIKFNLAYFTASGLTLALISLYTWAITKSKQIAGLLFGVLLITYSFIFIIIQLEDYALLIGSIGIFLILAIVMYLSRHIDWYELKLGDRIETNDHNPNIEDI